MAKGVQLLAIATVLSDRTGKYTIRNLSPGEYLVATAAGISPGEWFDPSLLERFVPGAVRVSIPDTDSKA